MTLRRAIGIAALSAAALVAAAATHAQDATKPPLNPDGTAVSAAPRGRPLPVPAPVLPTAAAEEPLQRLDPATLAGGDYGVTPEPNGALAGGDYGRDQTTPEQQQPPAPAVAAIGIGDPLTRRRDLRAGTTALRPLPKVSADDPYAPIGIRAGSFILRPTVESAGGYDDNPDRQPKGGKIKGSSFLRLRGDLDAVSDWSRHEVELKLSGQTRRYINLPTPGYEPEGTATLDGRLDVTERTQIVSQLRASITTSRPGDPDTPQDVKGDEIERSYGATLGLVQSFNRFSLKLEGLADRYLFDDSKLLDGTTLDNSDRVYNAYEVRLRGAYEISPGLQPFAEVAVDTRDYDKRIGRNGEQLGSSGYALRGGARFEASRLVTGELGVGYGRQTPKDNGLKPVDGLLVDGALAWTPTALTTVRLNARSAINETTTTGSGGILSRSVGVSVEHALRRNWTVTARADYERSQYKGAGRIDDTVVLALETEYRLNRTVSLIGSFQHERLDSNLPGEDYSASIIEFGMRVRR